MKRIHGDLILVLMCIAAMIAIVVTETRDKKPCNMELRWDGPYEDKLEYDGASITYLPSQIDGYLVRLGTQSGKYNTVITVWGRDNRKCMLENLKWNTTYYATVHSIGNGILSEPAQELSWTTPKKLKRPNKLSSVQVR